MHLRLIAEFEDAHRVFGCGIVHFDLGIALDEVVVIRDHNAVRRLSVVCRNGDDDGIGLFESNHARRVHGSRVFVGRGVFQICRMVRRRYRDAIRKRVNFIEGNDRIFGEIDGLRLPFHRYAAFGAHAAALIGFSR